MARSCLQTPNTDTRLTNIPADAKTVRMGVASPRRRLIVPPIVATVINNVALRTSVSYLIRSLRDSTSRSAMRLPVPSPSLSAAVGPLHYFLDPMHSRQRWITKLRGMMVISPTRPFPLVRSYTQTSSHRVVVNVVDDGEDRFSGGEVPIISWSLLPKAEYRLSWPLLHSQLLKQSEVSVFQILLHSIRERTLDRKEKPFNPCRRSDREDQQV